MCRIDVDGVHDVLEIRTPSDLESVGRALENCLANGTSADYQDELKTGVMEFWDIPRDGAVIGVLSVSTDTRELVQCLGARNEPAPVDHRTMDAFRYSIDAALGERERSRRALRSELNDLCQTRTFGTGRIQPARGSGRTFGTRPTASLKWTPLWPMVNIGEALVDNLRREGVSPDIGSVVHCDRALGYRKRTGILVGEKRIRTVSDETGHMTFSSLHSKDLLECLDVQSSAVSASSVFNGRSCPRRPASFISLPKEIAVTRHVSAMHLKQNDECSVARRYVTLE